MKKLRLILVIGGFLLTLVSSAQTITYRLANPSVVYYGALVGNYFSFDVQLMASTTPTYIWAGQVNVSFNPAVLSSNVVDWSVTPNNLILGGTYPDLIPPFTPQPKFLTPMVKAISANEFLVGWTPNPAVSPIAPDPVYHNLVPTVWTTAMTVLVKITGSTSDVSGNSFIHVGMDNQQFYHSGVNANTLYTVAYADELTNLYVGRIFANSVWTQAGVTPAGVDWTASVGTSIWAGAATIPATGVSLASNLRIHNPATLTIPVTGQLTVSGNTDVLTPGGLTIQSNASGTGSLISATSSGTGSAIAQRWMTAGKWNIVSSPLSGQSVANFLTGNPDNGVSGIALKAGNRGILEYLPVTNAWSLASPTGPAGNLGAGKGFLMRIPGLLPVTNDASVTFTGLLQAADQTLTGLVANKWNCVGNPYTSAIGITTASTVGAANFLNVNTVTNLNIDPAFGYLYLWVDGDASNGFNGRYKTMGNLAPGLPDNNVQQGQAFMIKMNLVANSLIMNNAMKLHAPALALKASKSPWPTIKLNATVDNKVSTTVIAFNNNMTKGLDPTYDAGLLKGSSDLVVYSNLVEGDTIPFTIQALPENDLTSMIIPVGIDFKTGGDVVFSADLLNLPANSKVVLEDKVAKTFTDLSKDTYKVAIAANSIIGDRFQLHTTDLSSKLGNNEIETLAGKLNAYAIKNIEIRVVGEVSNEAVATLYDVQGKVILIENLQEGSLNVIPTTTVKMGIYMLSVKDKGNIQTFKLMIRE